MNDVICNMMNRTQQNLRIMPTLLRIPIVLLKQVFVKNFNSATNYTFLYQMSINLGTLGQSQNMFLDGVPLCRANYL